ncbi:carboxylate--amine ligase [Geodermatophilus sabuli]|uniref:Predicted ATP-dependent carboligase, ATP-grasp superfamily n=1 Tax=Geodermatophilus sabuli TaxID=1564158 RepID=A0A285EK79_9ACTN|nr:carboxylate--amine ligase [Geodermatophilus sabuli]MBB3087070.1 putative ATP-grasp superfamily ATP-dependent carboligase [Geodermatophilus sabuli]SNX99407.1 Predicted ATP-dependent carboligase, ATP-grasp superfamily [Geodermatophilus sabuli]
MTEAGRPPAVILGGSFNSLSVARALGRQGIPVHALGDGAGGSLVSHSRYLRSYLDVASSATAADEWMAWLRTGPRGAVLLPCSDGALEFIARHRAELVEMGYCPAASADEVTLAMLDKERTYELARAVGVPAPRTAAVSTVDEVRKAGAAMDFPCALKPRHSHLFARAFGSKALIVDDAEELEAAFRATNEHGLEMIVTEIIPGDDSRYCSYYSYLDDDGTPLFHFTKRKPRQNPPGFGLGTFHVTDWVPDAAELGLRFFTGVGLRGVGNVEFKRDSRDGQLKIIECNPRFTAADKLVQRAGIDMATISYRRALGLPVTAPTTFRRGVTQWHPVEDWHAFRAYRALGQLSTVSWLRSLARPTGLPMFDPRDPRPSSVYAVAFAQRGLRFTRRRLASLIAGRRSR